MYTLNMKPLSYDCPFHKWIWWTLGIHDIPFLPNAAQELNVPPSTLREVSDQGICEPKGLYMGVVEIGL